jgi:hypothetical protein
VEAQGLQTSDSEPFRLALRVRHPSIDPDELTRAFAITPEHAHQAGTAAREIPR